MWVMVLPFPDKYLLLKNTVFGFTYYKVYTIKSFFYQQFILIFAVPLKIGYLF